MAIIRTYSYTNDDIDLIKAFDALPGGKSEKILMGMRAVLEGATPTININSSKQEWKEYFNNLSPQQIKTFQKKWVDLDYLLRKRVEKLL